MSSMLDFLFDDQSGSVKCSMGVPSEKDVARESHISFGSIVNNKDVQIETNVQIEMSGVTSDDQSVSFNFALGVPSDNDVASDLHIKQDREKSVVPDPESGRFSGIPSGMIYTNGLGYVS